jgi:hypothetical protein
VLGAARPAAPSARVASTPARERERTSGGGQVAPSLPRRALGSSLCAGCLVKRSPGPSRRVARSVATRWAAPSCAVSRCRRAGVRGRDGRQGVPDNDRRTRR